MVTSKQARMMIFLWILVLAMSCGKSKQSDGGEKSGSSPAASDKAAGTGDKAADGTTTAGSTKPGTTGTPAGTTPAPAINIPELIGKMTWTSEIFNNASGKVFTGFDGTNPFKVLVEVGVYGDLPETEKLTEEQAKTLFTSPEYVKAAKAEVAKLSFEADAAFVTMKMVEEFTEGRVYELTTVKAGTTTAKGKYGTKELPLAIQIASYTAAQVTAGKQRYNTAVAGATPSPACATCHRTATGADHSPYFMAQYTDAALLSTIEAGLNTDDNYQTKVVHKMTFTNAADKAGIVPYLRSLDPNLLPAQQAQ